MTFKILLVLALIGSSISTSINPSALATGKKILFVMTSNDKLGSSGKLTGNYLPEFAHPYNELTKEGYTIVFASPKGGKTPVDPDSYVYSKDDQESNDFLANKEAIAGIENTLKLDDVHAQDFAAIFYPGGNGPMFDLPENAKSQSLAREIYENGGVVSSVCHGTCGLVNVKLTSGEYLIKGKHVTGFSNSEEEIMQQVPHMPFLLETKIKENGGLYSQAENFASKVVVDGRIVTGQNPASSSEVGKSLHKVLSDNPK